MLSTIRCQAYEKAQVDDVASEEKYEFDHEFGGFVTKKCNCGKCNWPLSKKHVPLVLGPSTSQYRQSFQAHASGNQAKPSNRCQQDHLQNMADAKMMQSSMYRKDYPAHSMSSSDQNKNTNNKEKEFKAPAPFSSSTAYERAFPWYSMPNEDSFKPELYLFQVSSI